MQYKTYILSNGPYRMLTFIAYIISEILKHSNCAEKINACGNVPNITNGQAILNNASYPRKANVTCLFGYEPTKHTIKCQDNGEWEDVTCFMDGKSFDLKIALLYSDIRTTNYYVTRLFIYPRVQTMNAYFCIEYIFVKHQSNQNIS